MFAFFSTLLLCVITWKEVREAEGAAMFTQTPNSTVYFMEGKDGVLDWKYSLGDKAAEFEFITWSVIKGVKSSLLLFENATGFLAPGSNVPAEYIGRVNKTKQATLVIKNITFNDNDIILQCSISLKFSPGLDDDVKILVIGRASLPHPVHISSVGSSVEFICNATSVPKQYFLWFKQHGETQLLLANNNQNVIIVSATGSSILKLKNIADYDERRYICDATANVDQLNQARTYLQLTKPIKQGDTHSLGNRFLAAVDESQTFCCPVIGYPPPIVTWQKNGTKLQTGEKKCYNLASLKNDDFGNYSCEGTDGKTTIGPFMFSLVEEEEPVPGEVTLRGIDGTPEKPAKLEWKPLAGAEYYVVNVNGSGIKGDSVIGITTSLEIHYNTLVMVKGDNFPRETEICAGVTAFSSKAGVIGKAPKCQKLRVTKPADVE
ncbi:uncharacterized protein [Montipora capricornis]|uniref:uncharacterized protein n=1 Tax=Montipora capricornis TaxID=246305 RepID=UPI0035F18E9D